jgi:hypothetical protein
MNTNDPKAALAKPLAKCRMGMIATVDIFSADGKLWRNEKAP